MREAYHVCTTRPSLRAYALADGVLCGGDPVIWDRPDATDLFPRLRIASATGAAARKVVASRDLSPALRESELVANREIQISRYGSKMMFAALDKNLSRTDAFPQNAKSTFILDH